MVQNEYSLKNGDRITLRLEQDNDYHEVESLTREAFWKPEAFEKLGGIGANEHYLAYILRTSPEFVQELDYIAECDGRIIGNVMYSMAHVLLHDGQKHPVLTFGPLSVLPEYQQQGVGSILMRHTLKKAARLGYGAVIFFGHPTYYPRFGFKEAKEYKITTSRGDNFPAFMAMELIYGDLDGVEGSFHESPLFEVDNVKACEFDRLFPPMN
jgi:predicted N-acetyltransferase YhbS